MSLYCVAVFCVVCFFWVFLTFVAFFPSLLWYCWLGLLTCKTVSQITYTVLVETLNPAQSISQPPFNRFMPRFRWPWVSNLSVIEGRRIEVWNRHMSIMYRCDGHGDVITEWVNDSVARQRQRHEQCHHSQNIPNRRIFSVFHLQLLYFSPCLHFTSELKIIYMTLSVNAYKYRIVVTVQKTSVLFLNNTQYCLQSIN